MPTVLLQPALAVELLDASGSTAELRPNITRSASAAAGLAAGVALAELAGAASSCAPQQVLLRYTTKELSPATPAAGSVAGRTGVLIFETDTADQFVIVTIPSVRLDLVDLVDPYLLDLDAPPLAALISAIIAGLWVNKFGYNITNCVSGIVELRV